MGTLNWSNLNFPRISKANFQSNNVVSPGFFGVLILILPSISTLVRIYKVRWYKIKKFDAVLIQIFQVWTCYFGNILWGVWANQTLKNFKLTALELLNWIHRLLFNWISLCQVNFVILPAFRDIFHSSLIQTKLFFFSSLESLERLINMSLNLFICQFVRFFSLSFNIFLKFFHSLQILTQLICLKSADAPGACLTQFLVTKPGKNKDENTLQRLAVLPDFNIKM